MPSHTKSYLSENIPWFFLLPRVRLPEYNLPCSSRDKVWASNRSRPWIGSSSPSHSAKSSSASKMPDMTLRRVGFHGSWPQSSTSPAGQRSFNDAAKRSKVSRLSMTWSSRARMCHGHSTGLVCDPKMDQNWQFLLFSHAVVGCLGGLVAEVET